MKILLRPKEKKQPTVYEFISVDFCSILVGNGHCSNQAEHILRINGQRVAFCAMHYGSMATST